jgi:Nucleotidyl transferase AbiEii toxin, Type IV TA system
MLRKETVEPATLGLLKQLVKLPELQRFRLVGGTALSLLFGHRKSIDLDLFTDSPLEKEVFVPALEEAFGDVITTNESKNIYQCVIQSVKVDFVSVKDPFLNPIQIIEEIPFAHTKDLIALKLNAVKGRGVKKDFWDVAKLLEIYSMDELFQCYYERYPYDDSLALKKSMIWFENAEDNLDPECLDGMTWSKAKKVVTKSFNDFYKRRK